MEWRSIHAEVVSIRRTLCDRLVQPFGANGTAPPRGPQWYGAGDWHDANRLNNANALPVILAFASIPVCMQPHPRALRSSPLQHSLMLDFKDAIMQSERRRPNVVLPHSSRLNGLRPQPVPLSITLHQVMLDFAKSTSWLLGLHKKLHWLCLGSGQRVQKHALQRAQTYHRWPHPVFHCAKSRGRALPPLGVMPGGKRKRGRTDSHKDANRVRHNATSISSTPPSAAAATSTAPPSLPTMMTAVPGQCSFL